MECFEYQLSELLFPVLPVLMCPILIILAYAWFADGLENWGKWGNGIGAVLFVLLNHYQVLDIVSKASVPLPAQTEQTFETWAVTNDLFSIFNTACTGYVDFKSIMLVRIAAPAVFVVMAVLTVVASRILSLITPRLAMQRDRTLNIVGSILYAFFSAIAAMSLLLFKCQDNPNNKKTLIVDLSIDCYEEDWESMLVVAIISLVVYCVGIGTIFVRAVIIAPMGAFRDIGFQQRYKFLFIKYRAEAYWWGIVFLLKNVLINLAFVIFSDGLGQLYFAMTMVGIYTILVVNTLPYRHRIANVAEVGASASILFVCSLMTWFAPRDDVTYDDSLGLVAAIISFLPLVIGFLSILYVVYQGVMKPTTGAHDQQHNLESDFALLQTMAKSLTDMGREEAMALLTKFAEWDRFYLVQSAAAFDHFALNNPWGLWRIPDVAFTEYLSTQIAGTAMPPPPAAMPPPPAAREAVQAAALPEVEEQNLEEEADEYDFSSPHEGVRALITKRDCNQAHASPSSRRPFP